MASAISSSGIEPKHYCCGHTPLLLSACVATGVRHSPVRHFPDKQNEFFPKSSLIRGFVDDFSLTLPAEYSQKATKDMNFSEQCFHIFEQATDAYHVTDNVDASVHNPYPVKSIEFYLYLKNWIDAVQWHLEDIIRDPEIDPVKALAIKRRIDKSNQDRTDLVELIDSFFLDKYKHVKPLPDATINTESPAWAIDRLSILTLKIYHMREEASRTDADSAHTDACRRKLDVLLEQKRDLSEALDQLLSDIRCGRKYMKVYKQMKMYNDPALNPVLYGTKRS